jgi:hypothetical protein
MAESESAEQEEKNENQNKEFHEAPLSRTSVLVFGRGNEDGNPRGRRQTKRPHDPLAVALDPALPLGNAYQRSPARHVVAVEHAPELALDGLHPQ